jgi:hypothetical protein
MVEALLLTITPGFDETYRPQAAESLEWSPPCISEAFTELRENMGESCMSNFSGLNHALPLDQSVPRDPRCTKLDKLETRCQDPEI